MDIVVDASAYLAVVLNEPEKQRIIEITKGAEIISPEILPYEIGNALVAMFKRKRLSKEQVLKSFNIFDVIPTHLENINIFTALEIACKHNIYAYDAYYLELAQCLKLPLLTMDNQMKEIAIQLNIKTLNI